MPLPNHISDVLLIAIGGGAMRISTLIIDWWKKKATIDVEANVHTSNDYQRLVDLYFQLYKEMKESDELCRRQYLELQLQFQELKSDYKYLKQRFDELQDMYEKLKANK